jgi:hypothetical protein
MTANTTTATNGQLPLSDKSRPVRGPKRPKRKTVSRRAAKRVAKSGTLANSYSGKASRLISRGRKAAGGAYEWAADGAGRALPLAARHMPDQRSMQKLVDERPYLLGAIGLGIGAMIGLMLPARLLGGTVSPPLRPAKRASRKR